MAKRKTMRKIVSTSLLVVGEGADDKAFIDHMKSIFCPRRCGRTAKIEAGDGGSAGNIIQNAIRSFKTEDFDKRYLVLDSDVPPTDAEIKKAYHNGYKIILWSPQCLEGALLDVLGERVNTHETSRGLKKRLHPRLDGKHTAASSYKTLFPQAIIESTHNASVTSVKDILLGTAVS